MIEDPGGSGPVFGEPGRLTPEELRLAMRNHGLPLEALRYPITPPGLHYTLIHYDVPAVDPDGWTLEIGGRVERPLRLTLADLHERPHERVAVTLECAGNGRALMAPRALSQPWLHEAVGTAEWGGTSLWPVLADAGIDTTADEVVFTGLDRGVERGFEQAYARSLSLDQARRPEVLLVDEMNGQPLPPQHGAPVRLVVPGWYGMASVKWLSAIEVIRGSFDGFQQRQQYRLRQAPDEPGEPLERMLPRALMVPPGIPDFFTRRRVVRPGPLTLVGRAWSGRAPIERVDVSVDGGTTWVDAVVEPPALGPWAWQGWSFEWTAEPGDVVLACRATDGIGPTDAPAWNVGGYVNPAPHLVEVTVLD